MDDAEFYNKLAHFPYLTVLISIPEEFSRRIERIQNRLKRIDDRQLYHHPSNLHITVKLIGFLGKDVRGEYLPRIRDKVEKVAAGTSPFSATLRGLGVFPDAIYADVQEGKENIRKLHVEIRRELRRYSVTSRYEGENMHPHMTIATILAAGNAERLIQEVGRSERTEIGRMRVDKIKLVRVIPHEVSEEKRASLLEDVASFPLGFARG